MSASGSRLLLVLLFLLLGAARSGCSAGPDAFARGDEEEALLLLQVGAESVRGASLSLQGFAQEVTAAPVEPAAESEVVTSTTATKTAVAAADASVPHYVLNMKKCTAEFIAMTLFVFLGCGSAMSVAKTRGSAWVLQVSLSFGLTITVLAFAIGHYSGGQINCAVTFGLVLVGNLTVVQAIGNVVAQLLGSILGALILRVMYGPSSSEGAKDLTGGLGTNSLADGWPAISALVGESLGTFLLVYVVLETAVNPANSPNSLIVAPLAIGLAVFLAHSVLVPVDGCSINPSRSFGPALVNAFDDHGFALVQLWIFIVGPLLGAAAAAGVYALMIKA